MRSCVSACKNRTVCRCWNRLPPLFVSVNIKFWSWMSDETPYSDKYLYVLNKRLPLDSHVKAMSKAIYCHICAFRHIRHTLKVDTANRWPVRYWDRAFITQTRSSSAFRQRTSPSDSSYRTLSPELSFSRTFVRKPFQYWNKFTGYQSNTGLTWRSRC